MKEKKGFFSGEARPLAALKKTFFYLTRRKMAL
jgi:hypothetical protein